MKNELRMLGSDAVTVRDPFIHHSFQLETAYLLSLEPQRLLAGFRETAGFPADAHRYGGWERTEIQGHTLGHYLTAMAQAWAVSGNPEIQQRIRETIDALRECQRTDGYLFASAEELFHRVERKEPVWVPWYTMHKIVAGLVSVCTLTGYPEAEIVLRNLAEHLLPCGYEYVVVDIQWYAYDTGTQRKKYQYIPFGRCEMDAYGR